MPLIHDASKLNARVLAPILYEQFWKNATRRSPLEQPPAFENISRGVLQDTIDMAQGILDALMNNGVLSEGEPEAETAKACIVIAGRKLPTPDGEREMVGSEIVHAIGREILGRA